MKDNQFSISSKSNFFSENIISRCPNSNCIFIPQIYLFNKEGIDYIHYKCKKFICKDCKLKHDMENKEHSLIDINDIDKYCPEHNKICVIYCEDCEKSFCTYCPNHPKNHNVELIQRMKIEEKEIKHLENQIQNSKIFMTKIKKLYENIIEEINKLYKEYKEMNELEIKLIEDLMMTYKNSERYKQLNAEIIMNIKNNIKLNEMKE